VIAHRTGVPLVLIDTPFVYHDEAPPHAVEFVRRQIEDAIPVAERIAGRALDAGRLAEVIRLSREAVDLWAQVLARGRQRPAPLAVFEQFLTMAPIVEFRGEARAVEFCGHARRA
jgi:benzoyl-CoA reductase/2-hydroxyglutaryl-CoA dehydratase subunit BcrC/BadD/HgdB